MTPQDKKTSPENFDDGLTRVAEKTSPHQENPIEQWINESDVDGRKVVFQFTDCDIPILRDAIRQEIKEERQRLAREIRMIKVEDGLDSNYLWSEGFDAGQNNMLRRILELLEGK